MGAKVGRDKERLEEKPRVLAGGRGEKAEKRGPGRPPALVPQYGRRTCWGQVRGILVPEGSPV